MRLDTTAAPITDDDATIRAALEDVEVVPLLVAVAGVTGDRSILREHLRPDPLLWLQPDAGMTPEQMAEACDLATGALGRWRDAGCPARTSAPDLDEIRELVDFIAGGTLTDEY